MKFSDLRLAEPILRAVASDNYVDATPIQAQAIPQILAGKDVLGCAQTGTGKTAAFALPILHKLAESPSQRNARSLILVPTRELATQIADSFRDYGRNLKQLRSVTIFGGVNQSRQVESLRRGVDIIIATPGRLLDLMNQGHVDLHNVEMFVLDEADRMLDMGFIPDIRKITSRVPAARQTMLFSATMPNEIRRLADSLLRNPVTVTVTPVASTVDLIDQSVYFVDKKNKPFLLAHLYTSLPMSRVIVFTRTKHGADRVVRQLHARGIRAEAIHGNKSQNARNRAMENFKAFKTPILVATDIASRGIDVDGVSHVVNFDLTHEPETYVHRIGRTARAGASGSAVSFCDRDERSNLRAIESLIRQSIPVKNDQPTYPAAEPLKNDWQEDRPREGRQNSNQRGGQRHEGRSRDPRREERPREQRPTQHVPQVRRAGPPAAAAAPQKRKSFPLHKVGGGAKRRPQHAR